MPNIAPGATVDPRAELADDVEIGPGCYVGPMVKIGPGCRLIANVTILGHTEIGSANLFYPSAVLGAAPQDLAGINPALCVDPYTNHELGYVPRDRGYLVYSYGIDGRDDRGDTDGERTSPDVLLEDAIL